MGDGGGPVIWRCYNTRAKTTSAVPISSLALILNKTNIINHAAGRENIIIHVS